MYCDEFTNNMFSIRSDRPVCQSWLHQMEAMGERMVRLLEAGKSLNETGGCVETLHMLWYPH